MVSASYRENFHHLVAEVIDDFDGETVRLGARKRARFVPIERRPGILVDFGFERRFERLVWVVCTHEIGVSNEETLLVIVGVDEPRSDVVLAASADFSDLG